MTSFEAQCELEALKVDALGRYDYDIRDRLCEVASQMCNLSKQIDELPYLPPHVERR